MIQKLLVLLLVFNCSLLYAQTIKTDVVVVGGSASGVAAALQSARSKLKTVLVTTDSKPGESLPTGETFTVNVNNDLPSGIWGEFRLKIHDYYKGKKAYDTAYNAPLKFERAAALAVFKDLTDTVKNLTIYTNSVFISIKKDGDRWAVVITQNGKTITIKARVVIDATANGDVATKAGGQFPTVLDNLKSTAGSNAYRTSIASGEGLPGQMYKDAIAPKANYPPYPSYYVPMSAVLLKGPDNILITEKALPVGNNIADLPLQLQLGQGVGTIAAYCAFFKTTTQHLNVRIIQGELLDFKGYILPFTDVNPKDSDWRAIQQVGASGLLKGVQQIKGSDVQFVFMPDSTVNTAEIKPVLNEIYTRAFLWMNKEKPGEKFTLGNLLSFISDFTLTDPQALQSSVQRSWKTQYKFKLDFDPRRAVTRREFAVLANRLLNPFARTVDLSGRLVN